MPIVRCLSSRFEHRQVIRRECSDPFNYKASNFDGLRERQVDENRKETGIGNRQRKRKRMRSEL